MTHQLEYKLSKHNIALSWINKYLIALESYLEGQLKIFKDDDNERKLSFYILVPIV